MVHGVPGAGRALGRIDTHQHIVPDFYREWLSARGMSAGGLPIPDWRVDQALAWMDEAQIQTAVLSISTPGVHLGSDREARTMARRVNEFAADVVARHPDRFGFFATLALPDVDGAMIEATHALDVLGADGVVLLANSQGRYLGDAAFEPLMAELNRRRSVVFVHPSDLPGPAVPGLAPSVADFLLDTTRAAVLYARSGGFERHPDLRIILSHGGGFVPYAAERLARACTDDGDQARGLARLRQFHFDTALASSPYALAALFAFADPARIVFGSDWPYAPRPRALHFLAQLEACEMGQDRRESIARGNAIDLFARRRVGGAAMPLRFAATAGFAGSPGDAHPRAPSPPVHAGMPASWSREGHSSSQHVQGRPS